MKFAHSSTKGRVWVNTVAATLGLSLIPQLGMATNIVADGAFSIHNSATSSLIFRWIEFGVEPRSYLRSVQVTSNAPNTSYGIFPNRSVVRFDEAVPSATQTTRPIGIEFRSNVQATSTYAHNLVGFTDEPLRMAFRPGGPFIPNQATPPGTTGSPSVPDCATYGYGLQFAAGSPFLPCTATSRGATRAKTLSDFEYDEFLISINGFGDIGIGYELGMTRFLSVRLADLPTPKSTSRVIEFRNTAEFPGSPGGQFFYTADVNEAAFVDSGGAGRYVRTGKSFNAGGFARSCRFYGSQRPGPNSHFYTVSESGCEGLRGLAKSPIPSDTQQWNFEGYSFATGVPRANADGTTSCSTGTVPVYRAYNRAFPESGPRNVWDSNHRFSINKADIDEVVALGWKDEGVAMCAPA
jgi:hypothetical protein